MNILILGANSSVAQALVRLYSKEKHRFYLVGRDPIKLACFVDEILVGTNSGVYSEYADLADVSRHQGIIDRAVRALGSIDTVLIAYGALGDHSGSERDYEKAWPIYLTNMLSPIAVIMKLCPIFERQGHGTLAVITSVAGDRGRASNYIYGSAKGGLSIYLSGLRARMASCNVGVVDVRLGLVDSPMTSHLKKGLLWSSPVYVAKVIARAIRKNRGVAYVPWFWSPIMAVVRAIPQPIFNRLRF